MATCATCSAELQPAWKFCIQCGTAVIPAAIRPALVATTGRRARLVSALGSVLTGQVSTVALFGMILVGLLGLVGILFLVAYVLDNA